MLSKSKIKLIQSLKLKKYRDETGMFVAEGTKLVTDMLPFFKCRILAATPEWLNTHSGMTAMEVIESDMNELKKASHLTTPSQVLAVFEKPVYGIDYTEIRNSLSIVLDGIQDPGNLGTIVRIADWFGIENVICSENTADLFNPKTIQASMGAITRVKVHYMALRDFFERVGGDLPVFGTFLEGEVVYDESLPANGLVVMGNEGKGISAELEGFITRKLFIPSFPPQRKTSESLNVAVATAIICSEFRRQADSYR